MFCPQKACAIKNGCTLNIITLLCKKRAMKSESLISMLLLLQSLSELEQQSYCCALKSVWFHKKEPVLFAIKKSVYKNTFYYSSFLLKICIWFFIDVMVIAL